MTAELFLICHDVLTYVRQLTPFASRSSALSPKSGKADTKEERIHSFLYKLNPKIRKWLTLKSRPPDDGKQANHFSRSGATLQKCVRRFALAKVAALAVGRGKCEQKQKVRKWFP